MMKKQKSDSVVGGVAWKFGERILSQGVAFIVSLILARLLAPADYGTIALVLVFINIADVFVVSGFATSLIQKKDADDLDFSTMFYCSVVCTALIYVVLYFCAPLIANFYSNRSLVKIVRVFALRIPLSAYFSIQTAYISRNMLFRKSFFSSLTAQIIAGGTGIVMAIKGFGVWALIAQYFANTLVSSLVLMFVISWRPKLLFSWERAKSLMRFGSKILLADLSGTFFNELRSLLIGRSYTEADLAYYNKGQQLPHLISNNLNTTIMSVLFPALANEADDIQRVKSMTRRGISCLCYILMPVMFGMAAVMQPTIRILYTSKWDVSIFFGQIFCISSAISFIGVVSLQVLKALGYGGSVLKLELYKKPVYLLLLIIGMKINVPAIALTLLVYDCYSTSVNLYQLCRKINYRPKEIICDIFPSTLLAGIMALAVLQIRIGNNEILTLIVGICVGAAIYCIGSILFRIKSFIYLLNMCKDFLSKKKKA